MPTNYKKSELVELVQILSLPTSPKLVKAQLEKEIENHLAAKPADAQLDPRLSTFVGKAAAGATPPSDEEEEATGEEKLEEKVAEVTEKVGGAWSRAKVSGQRYAHEAFRHVGDVRTSLSTVASVNWLLLIIEYLAVGYSKWPASYFTSALFGFDGSYEYYALEAFWYTVVYVLPALVFSYVINFTKNNAIRRKKHVYTVDPILFGLARFFISAIRFIIVKQIETNIAIAGASGLTAALLGIYASVLQTP